ncbi:FixH family protein [Pseudoxanthomonas spadix]|jgi:hypothetical protein|uniref:FixH family protein n=1 Tax=Pseudoxanthomonas spadix TaxID=415229 RepID=UPI000EFEDC2D|nr:FixH family protein [Pseudoxanthomonas spadix]MBP3975474.1 FixH family protein [Pseudoxanthomonas spadix]RMW92749.1 nitrogen fixation protein FixH [Pseudoxanthomonas spadix]
MSRSDSTNRARPFWREPMVWLVLGIPLVSIVVGVGLVVVATRSGGNDAVGDQVQRVSQIQTTDLGPDQAARQRGLLAVLRVVDGAVEVLPASAGFDRAAPLRATFEHPLHARADLQLQLQPSALGWRAPARIDNGHHWRVQLAPADGSWRLRGRLPRQQQAVRLAPALSSGD